MAIFLIWVLVSLLSATAGSLILPVNLRVIRRASAYDLKCPSATTSANASEAQVLNVGTQYSLKGYYCRGVVLRTRCSTNFLNTDTISTEAVFYEPSSSDCETYAATPTVDRPLEAYPIVNCRWMTTQVSESRFIRHMETVFHHNVQTGHFFDTVWSDVMFNETDKWVKTPWRNVLVFVHHPTYHQSCQTSSLYIPKTELSKIGEPVCWTTFCNQTGYISTSGLVIKQSLTQPLCNKTMVDNISVFEKSIISYSDIDSVLQGLREDLCFESLQRIITTARLTTEDLRLLYKSRTVGVDQLFVMGINDTLYLVRGDFVISTSIIDRTVWYSSGNYTYDDEVYFDFGYVNQSLRLYSHTTRPILSGKTIRSLQLEMDHPLDPHQETFAEGPTITKPIHTSSPTKSIWSVLSEQVVKIEYLCGLLVFLIILYGAYRCYSRKRTRYLAVSYTGGLHPRAQVV